MIKKIRIKNFRSFGDVSIDTKRMNVFVGSNDAGKSNVLRALDLFFNSDNEYRLNWQRDFCNFANVAAKKAKEITIQVSFDLPASYKQTSVVWTRTWREGVDRGFHYEEIKTSDGEELPAKSRARAFLKSIRYDYIPAIKDNAYFAKLLSKIHDMLDQTVQSDIREASESFTDEIRKHVPTILAELRDKLGLESEIRLPTELRQFFSDLEFHSKSGANFISLDQHGDGIKVQHIPIILRWLAEQANIQAARGRPQVTTIWGYEEPENNVEIKKCFGLAQDFFENSGAIQTFVTTHSPIFYTVIREKGSSNASVFEVINSPEGSEILARDVNDATHMKGLNSSLGFFDLLMPHIQAEKNRIELLEEKIRFLDGSLPTVFVEGESDKIILEALLKKDHPGLVGMVNFFCGGGHAWVKDSIAAWHYNPASSVRAVGLFDSDDGAKGSVDLLPSEVREGHSQKALIMYVKPAYGGPAQKIIHKQIKLPTSIDELCPYESWLEAETKGWLEDRGAQSFCQPDSPDKTLRAFLEDQLGNDNLVKIVLNKIQMTKKDKFSKLIVRKTEDASCDWDFSALTKLLKEALNKLKLIS